MDTAGAVDSGSRGKTVASRQGTNQQDEPIRLEELRKKLGYLIRLHKTAETAKEEFAEAVRAVAESAGLQAKIVRRFVAAKAGTTFEKKKKEAEQLSLVFEEVA